MYFGMRLEECWRKRHGRKRPAFTAPHYIRKTYSHRDAVSFSLNLRNGTATRHSFPANARVIIHMVNIFRQERAVLFEPESATLEHREGERGQITARLSPLCAQRWKREGRKPLVRMGKIFLIYWILWEGRETGGGGGVWRASLIKQTYVDGQVGRNIIR